MNEITKMNSELMKMNSELIKMNSELIKMNTGFIDVNYDISYRDDIDDYDYDIEGYSEEDSEEYDIDQIEHAHGYNRIEELRPLVKEYIHDDKNPELPKEPDGSLFGIGFIYDEDRDDRVLVAIDKLKHLKGIIAVSEHEGGMDIYSRSNHKLKQIGTCGDIWFINEFVFKKGKWNKVK